MFKTILLFVLAFTPVEENIVRASVKTQHRIQVDKSIVTQSGSGTIIKQEKDCFWVLSCAHAFEYNAKYGEGKIAIYIHNGQIYPATLVSYDVVRDISLLKVLFKPDISAAKLAKEAKYTRGETIFKSGYPKGLKHILAKGECTGWFSNSVRDPSVWSFIGSVVAISGDSGGGSFNEQGELIGVNWGSLPDGLRSRMLGDIRIFLKRVDFRE